jgi:hypothetical protein
MSEYHRHHQEIPEAHTVPSPELPSQNPNEMLDNLTSGGDIGRPGGRPTPETASPTSYGVIQRPDRALLRQLQAQRRAALAAQEAVPGAAQAERDAAAIIANQTDYGVNLRAKEQPSGTPIAESNSESETGRGNAPPAFPGDAPRGDMAPVTDPRRRTPLANEAGLSAPHPTEHRSMPSAQEASEGTVPVTETAASVHEQQSIELSSQTRRPGAKLLNIVRLRRVERDESKGGDQQDYRKASPAAVQSLLAGATAAVTFVRQPRGETEKNGRMSILATGGVAPAAARREDLQEVDTGYQPPDERAAEAAKQSAQLSEIVVPHQQEGWVHAILVNVPTNDLAKQKPAEGDSQSSDSSESGMPNGIDIHGLDAVDSPFALSLIGRPLPATSVESAITQLEGQIKNAKYAHDPDETMIQNLQAQRDLLAQTRGVATVHETLLVSAPREHIEEVVQLAAGAVFKSDRFATVQPLATENGQPLGFLDVRDALNAAGQNEHALIPAKNFVERIRYPVEDEVNGVPVEVNYEWAKNREVRLKPGERGIRLGSIEGGGDFILERDVARKHGLVNAGSGGGKSEFAVQFTRRIMENDPRDSVVLIDFKVDYNYADKLAAVMAGSPDISPERASVSVIDPRNNKEVLANISYFETPKGVNMATQTSQVIDSFAAEISDADGNRVFTKWAHRAAQAAYSKVNRNPESGEPMPGQPVLGDISHELWVQCVAEVLSEPEYQDDLASLVRPPSGDVSKDLMGFVQSQVDNAMRGMARNMFSQGYNIDWEALAAHKGPISFTFKGIRDEGTKSTLANMIFNGIQQGQDALIKKYGKAAVGIKFILADEAANVFQKDNPSGEKAAESITHMRNSNMSLFIMTQSGVGGMSKSVEDNITTRMAFRANNIEDAKAMIEGAPGTPAVNAGALLTADPGQGMIFTGGMRNGGAWLVVDHPDSISKGEPVVTGPRDFVKKGIDAQLYTGEQKTTGEQIINGIIGERAEGVRLNGITQTAIVAAAIGLLHEMPLQAGETLVNGVTQFGNEAAEAGIGYAVKRNTLGLKPLIKLDLEHTSFEEFSREVAATVRGMVTGNGPTPVERSIPKVHLALPQYRLNPIIHEVIKKKEAPTFVLEEAEARRFANSLGVEALIGATVNEQRISVTQHEMSTGDTLNRIIVGHIDAVTKELIKSGEVPSSVSNPSAHPAVLEALSQAPLSPDLLRAAAQAVVKITGSTDPDVNKKELIQRIHSMRHPVSRDKDILDIKPHVPIIKNEQATALRPVDEKIIEQIAGEAFQAADDLQQQVLYSSKKFKDLLDEHERRHVARVEPLNLKFWNALYEPYGIKFAGKTLAEQEASIAAAEEEYLKKLPPNQRTTPVDAMNLVMSRDPTTGRFRPDQVVVGHMNLTDRKPDAIAGVSTTVYKDMNQGATPKPPALVEMISKDNNWGRWLQVFTVNQIYHPALNFSVAMEGVLQRIYMETISSLRDQAQGQRAGSDIWQNKVTQGEMLAAQLAAQEEQ